VPEALKGSLFAAPPPVGAAALVAAQMHRVLPPLLSALSDWTASGACTKAPSW
jgi:hypothetical protein